MSPLKIFVFLFTLTCLPKIYAEDTLANKYPRVVLVQLSSEHNRIAAMTKARDYKALKEVTNDALQVRKRMMADFTKDFNYCPVYYYIDTNAELIKNKQFDGILMNADSTPVINPGINRNSDDYVIVYYGYAISQPKAAKAVTDSDKYTYDYDSPPGKGLVILNDKFQQISHFYTLGYEDLFFTKEGKEYYASKHYDINYYPFARLFNERLTDKRRKKHKIRSGAFHAN